MDKEDLLCVADRENKRVVCYEAGTQVKKGESDTTGMLRFSLGPAPGPIYGVDYLGKLQLKLEVMQLLTMFLTRCSSDDKIYAVNGYDVTAEYPVVSGLTYDLLTGNLADVWRPEHVSLVFVEALSDHFFSQLRRG